MTEQIDLINRAIARLPSNWISMSTAGFILSIAANFPAVASEINPVNPDSFSHLSQVLDSEFDSESESEDEEQEDEVDIEIFVEHLLNQPVFAPFRGDRKLRDSSRPVYIVPREQIEVQGAVTVQDALQFVPGVLSDGTTGGQLGSLSSQFMRGGDTSQTLILLNGRPINDLGFFGGFDLAEFTTDAVQRLEVVPGGSSTLYGSSGVGGTINIVTQSPTEEPEFVTEAGVGSFGYNQQVIQTRGTEGDFGWVIGYNRTYSDNDFPFELETIDFEGDRENAEVNYNNINAKLSANIGDRNRLTLSGLYLTRDFGVAGGVPTGEGSLGQFNRLTPEANRYTEDLFLDLLWESQLNSEGNSLLTARVYNDNQDYTFRDPDSSRDEIEQNSFGLQVQHNWKIADAHHLTYGADFRTVSSENTTFNFDSGDSTENFDDNINRGAIFARYEVDITPDFSANIGIRQEFNSLENGSFTSPSAGLLWNATDSTTLRANYARSFNAPLISELQGLAAFNVEGNPDLGSEKGNSFDIGIDQKIGNFGLFRLTFFLNRISDSIAFEFGSPSTYSNLGEVEAKGIEAAIDVEVVDNVFAFANFTLNDTEILEDVNESIEGNELSFRDANSFNFGIAYATPEGFYAGIFMHNISEYFVDNANTESLDGYRTVDLKLQVPVNDNFKINVSLNNIFDEDYEVSPGFPGLSRNFQTSVKLKF